MRFLWGLGLVLVCAGSSARAAIVIDGTLNEPEWTTAASAVNTVASNWTTANRLDRVRAFADATYLYVAIEGAVETPNTILLYADTAPGGISDLTPLADLTGVLDYTLSGTTIVAHGGLRPDAAWGTRQMNTSAPSATDVSGWRRWPPYDNLAWLSGSMACSASACETRVPLAELGLLLGTPTIRLFVRICDPTGVYFANQELPMDDPANPQSASTWLTVLRPPATAVPAAPPDLRLCPNQPNPFNPLTTIRFDLPAAGNVRLAVYDIAGRLVKVLAGGEMAAGSHEAVWDGRDSAGRAMASGSYLARLETGGKVESVRMSLIR